MSNLRKLRAQQNPEQEQTRAHKPFKAYEPGYVHIDVKYLPQMADEDRRSYLFVAIDRATRWVYVQVRKTKTAADAAAFIKALHNYTGAASTHTGEKSADQWYGRVFQWQDS